MASPNNHLTEYTHLQSMIGNIEAEISQEKSLQSQLRQQIAEYYRRLKDIFTEHWPVLFEKQV